MATRDHRLAEFNNGPPPLGQSLQLLCEDYNGTYLLPFRCEWRDGAGGLRDPGFGCLRGACRLASAGRDLRLSAMARVCGISASCRT